MAKAELRLLARAREDLIELRRYGRREFGDDAAQRLSDDIEGVFSLRRDNPCAGAEVSASLSGTRVFSKRGHRIFYRVTDQTVIVQRVLHHSRDAPRHTP